MFNDQTYTLRQVAEAARRPVPTVQSWVVRYSSQHVPTGGGQRGKSRGFSLRGALEICIASELALMGLSVESAISAGAGFAFAATNWDDLDDDIPF